MLLFKEKGWSAKRLLSLFMLILGSVIMPLCLVLTFLPKQKSVSGVEEESEAAAMLYSMWH